MRLYLPQAETLERLTMEPFGPAAALRVFDTPVRLPANTADRLPEDRRRRRSRPR